jgi:hypothetical protein
MSDLRFESGAPFSEADLVKIEREVGRTLPFVYREFVKTKGGAFVGGSVDGREDLPVLSFFSNDSTKGVLSKLATHPDLRDAHVLPIADCELGNLYVLAPDDTVHYINYYGGTTTTMLVASSFQDFINRIRVSEEI